MKKTAGNAALRVKWSYKAIRQLADIIDYIDQHNSIASVSLQRKALAAAQKLSSIPHGYRSGRVPGTREMVVHPNYLLIYRVNGEIDILRVLHARQKYPRTPST
ncbi:type II toxin-antitoxin system RelE/ParE family toxin [Pseudomonas sp. SWRI99]|uniref:type II toxin-antitoxin system RelE/ParE family toxin n=1 Tax=Pseudomonas sp. SWRI99 TaxID=2745506 RepID=UPI001EE25BC1|nr:type II toxin-antitoxin system RelE/ParE family toxin [Pseudomonas sp. SWRI99]